MHRCGDHDCQHKCVSCRKFSCGVGCEFYKPRECEKLKKPPYVCNGCPVRPHCTLEKKFYRAETAHSDYKKMLSESRTGISVSEEELERLEKEEKRLEGELKRSNSMLSNERFLSKAPAEKIEEEKAKLADYEKLMEQVKKQIADLKK
jgi:valyl-tRNA synthetase